MRQLTVALLFFSCVSAQTKFVTWNLENFGKSKSDTEITFMAKTLKEFDLIAIQEVVAGDGGAQAVARLSDELNRTGTKWDYTISDPTFGNPTSKERYAFVWKTSKLKIIGKAWLEARYKVEIEREPFMATFEESGKAFTIATFHAVPKSKKPETEIKYLQYIPQEYASLNIIFAGDFNCAQSHNVFNPLKQKGYLPAVINQKTSLKQNCIEEECLASEYDNIFYQSKNIKLIEKGVLPFYKEFPSNKEARHISDHIPVWFEFSVN